jgi:hypothetical protein
MITKKYISVAITIMVLLPLASAQTDIARFGISDKDSVTVSISGEFALQFQALSHSNEPDTFAANQLNDIVPGFNNATGNLGFTVQLYDGIVSFIDIYLSSEHHSDMWMREGYIEINKLKMFNSNTIDNIMDYITIKAGQMEVNYGDLALRRSDNGDVQKNPLVGNYLIDANTTEIAAEIYFNYKALMIMGGLSGGTTTGDIMKGHGYALYGKLAFDKQLLKDLQFRLSGSVYSVDHSNNPATFGAGTINYLFSGNRSGSRYKGLFNAATDAGQINPAAGQKIFAYQINPFINIGNLELFGVFEQTKDKDTNGNAPGSPEESWTHYGAELVYRIGHSGNLYVAARYNAARQTAGPEKNANVTRIQGGAGYFLTSNILLKAEFVNQDYNDFSVQSIYHEGNFKGLVLEASVSF